MASIIITNQQLNCQLYTYFESSYEFDHFYSTPKPFSAVISLFSLFPYLTHPLSRNMWFIILPLLFIRKMLKKGDNFLNNLNITKKSKLYTQPNESYCDYNKENLGSKSLFEHLSDSNINEQGSKQKTHEQSGYGSAMISPTFQSPDLVNLKDDRFRQDKSYLNINFSLKDMEKTSKDQHKLNPTKQSDNSQRVYEEKRLTGLQEVQELKRRLIEHYSKKKYWKKIQALFQQEGVNAVLAWEDAIEKYKSVKTSNEQLFDENRRLESEIAAKDQRIAELQKQLAQDKNETKILSHKKCKGCQTLQQKEKDYFELYELNKKTVKQFQQLKESYVQSTQQCKKIDEKYKNLIFLKEEVEKKNGKLLEREKQLTSQFQKMEKTLKEVKEDSSSSKELHIEIEQLKEAKYQIQKSITKMEEKYKREISDLKLELNGVEQEKNILLSQSEKVKLQLNQTKSKLFKMQFELESVDETLKIKSIECDEAKKRHIENMSEGMRKKNGLDDLLKNKEQELKKSYHLIDEMENMKVNIEMELNQERKLSLSKDEQLNKQGDNIRELQEKLREMEDKFREMEDKLRQLEESEHRIKEANQVYSINRNKNVNSCNFQGNVQMASSSPQGNSLLLRISSKIKELHCSLTQGAQENPDSYQKRRNREDLSDERQQVNLLKTERYVNELITEFFNFRNRYDFIQKDNQNLKLQLENQTAYKQQEMELLQREIDLKEEALRSLISWTPEQLRDLVVEFLCMTEQLSKDKCHDLQFEEYDELKQTLESQGKEWKKNYEKIYDDLRRVQQENEELRRRLKMKDVKKPLQAQYDYRQITKKDIRKKYNLGN